MKMKPGPDVTQELLGTFSKQDRTGPARTGPEQKPDQPVCTTAKNRRQYLEFLLLSRMSRTFLGETG